MRLGRGQHGGKQRGVALARGAQIAVKKRDQRGHLLPVAAGGKPVLYETWAYEEGSNVLKNYYPNMTSEDMHKNVARCYHEIEKEEGFDGLIPSGELMLALLKSGVEQIHRDSYHLTLGLGRYAAGLLWFRMLTGKSVAENAFADFDEPICPEHIALAKKLVDAMDPLV